MDNENKYISSRTLAYGKVLDTSQEQISEKKKEKKKRQIQGVSKDGK